MNAVIFCFVLFNLSVVSIFFIDSKVIHSDCLHMRSDSRPSSHHIPLPEITINDIIIYDEPGVPGLTDIPYTQNILLSRHHVIPWSTIRDFFNLMLDDANIVIANSNACQILNNIMTDIIGMIIGPNNTIDTITFPDIQNNVIWQLVNSATLSDRRLLLSH